MKINFHCVLKGLEGQPLKDEKGQDVTLGKIAMTALTNVYEDERNITGEEKLKRYDLALTIYALKDNALLDLPVETIAILKDLINKSYSTIVVGQAWRMLEGNTTISEN